MTTEYTPSPTKMLRQVAYHLNEYYPDPHLAAALEQHREAITALYAAYQQDMHDSEADAQSANFELDPAKLPRVFAPAADVLSRPDVQALVVPDPDPIDPALVNPFEGQPHAWIQFKGTDICMDVHCRCGAHLHCDGDFAYYVQCPHCMQWYACNGHIRLEPVNGEDIAARRGLMHVLEKSGDDFDDDD